LAGPIHRAITKACTKSTEISAPAKLVWFVDGGSGTALWSDDSWWIKDIVEGAEDDPGFNRLQEDDYGCRRHNGRANYVFADGHAGGYKHSEIRGDQGECWWSVRLDAHAERMATAVPAGSAGR